MEIATELMINEEIRDREVRVIDENGDQLGVMSIQQALALAEETGSGSGQDSACSPSACLQAAGLRQVPL